LIKDKDEIEKNNIFGHALVHDHDDIYGNRSLYRTAWQGCLLDKLGIVWVEQGPVRRDTYDFYGTFYRDNFVTHIL
jgi:hypothetical protein